MIVRDENILFSSFPRYSGLRRRSRRPKGTSSIWSMNLLNSLFIMPGTKWCGQGDVAKHYNDLGYLTADKCCRYSRIQGRVPFSD